MNFFAKALMILSLSLGSTALCAAAGDMKIGVVNFRKCVENSKLGKEEQTNFDKLKKKMETVLEEKEKTLNDMVEKTNDPDYLDSLSPEAETDLKRKLRALSQEMGQLQNQYLQALNQTQFKIVQKINDVISRASKLVAQNEKLDIVLNDESTFDYAQQFDISPAVVKEMDKIFDQDDMGAHLETSEGLELLQQTALAG